MNDKQHLSSLSHRKFGSCKIKWLIDEWPFHLFKQECVVNSPEFIVRGFEETRFTMNLQYRRGVENGLLFCLKRSLIDEGPELVRINMIVFFSISNYFHSEEKLLNLKNGSENETPLLGLGMPSKKMTLTNSSLKIVCKLLVYSKGSIGKFKECSDAGLKLLSNNMLSLYTSGKNSDVKLIVQDNIILAHKSVLCARNEMLRHLVEEHFTASFDDDEQAEPSSDDEEEVEDSAQSSDDDEEVEDYTSSSDDEEEGKDYTPSSDDEEEVEDYTTVEISSVDLDYNAMKKVLSYLYSGDLKHVLGEPSHAIYKCVEFLHITEVEAFYRPDELIFRTSVDVEKFTYVLLFPIFNKMHGDPYPTAHFCTDENVKPFHFDSLHGNSEMYVTLNTSIKVAVVDKNETCLFACNVSLCNKEKPIKICEIIKPRSIESHPTYDIMELTLTLKLCSSTRNSHIIKESTYIKTYYDDDFTYTCLSCELEDLFDGGLHSDISIYSSNLIHFAAHKCIIASRSCFFSDLINGLEMGEVIRIPNIETRILCVVLSYLYSGILTDVMDDDLVKVYNAAVKTKLPFLKSLCTGQLKKSLETNTTLRCRVMKIAEENNDKQLKKYVLDQLLKTVIRFPVSNEVSFSDVQPCRHC